jgi:hypothetical protein
MSWVSTAETAYRHAWVCDVTASSRRVPAERERDFLTDFGCQSSITVRANPNATAEYSTTSASISDEPVGVSFTPNSPRTTEIAECDDGRCSESGGGKGR